MRDPQPASHIPQAQVLHTFFGNDFLSGDDARLAQFEGRRRRWGLLGHTGEFSDEIRGTGAAVEEILLTVSTFKRKIVDTVNQ
ncbi:MAG: hypothetical protein A2486_06240 [Burkholderiales bacterium RIFOXYC12_FULL_65_23]|nr:MAG: hypothetical protein A2486_06240 [Burkholderiales bacterium RIFOXYC12_FULL_65_23]